MVNATGDSVWPGEKETYYWCGFELDVVIESD